MARAPNMEERRRGREGVEEKRERKTGQVQL